MGRRTAARVLALMVVVAAAGFAPSARAAASEDTTYVVRAVAASPDHLYAVVGDCGGPQCDTHRVIGSDDGGKTWTTRLDGIYAPFGDILRAWAPQTLTRDTFAGESHTKWLSVDGGRTWKGLAVRREPVPAASPGGWADLLVIDNKLVLCAVDPHRTRMAPLAAQPPLDQTLRVPTYGNGAIWAVGQMTPDPEDHTKDRGAAAVSRDAGRTWSSPSFDDSDYPRGSASYAGYPVSLDGVTGYVVVRRDGPEYGTGRVYVYRTTNAGASWTRLDPHNTLPWTYLAGDSYLTRDGIHVVIVDDGPKLRFWASHDGGVRYEETTRVTGLERLTSYAPAIQAVPGGGYQTHDEHRIYRSDDGLAFTGLEVSLGRAPSRG